MNLLCASAAFFGFECHHNGDMAPYKAAFNEHLAKFNIMYGTPEEYEFRFEQYMNKEVKIQAINQENSSFTLAHNKFSTYTDAEFKEMLGKKNVMPEAPELEFNNSAPLAAEVDWRKEGAVNPVQNQGQCGSCWAFSSIAAIEGSDFLVNGKLNKYSESQLVDCSSAEGNEGCNGGLEVWAFKYAESNKIESESDYPYKAVTSTCKSKKSKGEVELSTYARVTKNKVAALKAAVAVQPTCVSVDAADYHFQMYNGGILDASACGTDLDHAVTAVGYGNEGGKEYLIVRNSWGADWGESGYIRVAIDKDGAGICGILSDSAVPTAAKN